MRHILRQRELQADHWRHLGEQIAPGDAVIVPFAELRQARERWWAWDGRLGVRLAPIDRVEDLLDVLPRLDLVAVEFPNPGDGRGYSQGRLVRERYEFRGELRALGAGVRQDLVFLLARCGFDAIELAPGEDPQSAQRALARYPVAYQPGSAAVPVQRQRFYAA
ncbi:MAG TPA: DUF934 domain-containing protein [Steroidobacteraceae bacterium]|nr:DUF934 domain-containing protein [Steroidobacteraceae bacterium]